MLRNVLDVPCSFRGQDMHANIYPHYHCGKNAHKSGTSKTDKHVNYNHYRQISSVRHALGVYRPRGVPHAGFTQRTDPGEPDPKAYPLIPQNTLPCRPGETLNKYPKGACSVFGRDIDVHIVEYRQVASGCHYTIMTS